jgi:hypothetical protein
MLAHSLNVLMSGVFHAAILLNWLRVLHIGLNSCSLEENLIQ